MREIPGKDADKVVIVDPGGLPGCDGSADATDGAQPPVRRQLQIEHTRGATQPHQMRFEIDQRKLRKYGKRFFKISETGLRLKVIRQKGLRTALELKARKEGPR